MNTATLSLLIDVARSVDRSPDCVVRDWFDGVIPATLWRWWWRRPPRRMLHLHRLPPGEVA